MTRRIAITMMLTVWATILVAGVAVYFIARVILIEQLDDSMRYGVERSQRGAADSPTTDAMYVLKDQAGHTYAREALGRESALKLVKVSGAFTSDGRIRQVTFRIPDAPPGTVQLVQAQAEADDFHKTMLRLACAIAACGAIAGIAAALASARLAAISLRPLNQTASVIGTIDEVNLDRRIEAEALPVELRPMAGRLNEMLERLSRAFEQRRRFLADASHELRTPVAAMITTMEVALRRPRSASELTETLETCLSEARHMRLLVQALLRQVRAEGISCEEEPQNLDAGAMLKECADLAGSLAAERNVSVVRHLPGQVPVHAQPGRLRSVVLNLMSNAIEYNHEGGTVELSAQSDEASTEIIVKDDGPGISPEHLPHLFQPFYRASRSRESDGHLGLGLFLVESHVKAMGGECRVESALGRGTTFRVRLPGNAGRVNGNGGV
jgi:signal transduction histidine kinase